MKRIALVFALLLVCCAKQDTGAGPHATILAQDKSIAKKMFAFYGIQSPYFATAYRGNIDHAHDIKFPLIVKSLIEHASVSGDPDFDSVWIYLGRKQ